MAVQGAVNSLAMMAMTDFMTAARGVIDSMAVVVLMSYICAVLTILGGDV